MIKAKIGKDEPVVIEAVGDIPELLNDIGVLVGSIHTQFQNVNPAAALVFRSGLAKMVNDPNGKVWNPMLGTGIIFPKPEEEE